MDFGRYSAALVFALTLFQRYVCQVIEDIKTIEIGFQRVQFFGFSVVKGETLERYCEITIWEALFKVHVLTDTNGRDIGKLY